jgi:hypothetical protein
LNTRLPKLYFANTAYLLLQHNLQRIEPLAPRGMSGQVQYRIMNFEGKKNFNIQHPLFNIHNSGPYLPYRADLSHRSFSEGGWLLSSD